MCFLFWVTQKSNLLFWVTQKSNLLFWVLFWGLFIYFLAFKPFMLIEVKFSDNVDNFCWKCWWCLTILTMWDNFDYKWFRQKQRQWQRQSDGTQVDQIWYSELMMIIMLSYDDHNVTTSSWSRKDPTHAIYSKRRGLKDIKYDILVCRSCHMVIIKLLGLVHILSFIPSIWVSHSCTLSSCI